MSVVEIKTRPVAIAETVIARLEEVLKDAREGRIVSIAIAGVDLDGSILCTWSESDDFGRLLGAISRLQYRINFRQDSVCEPLSS